VSGAPYSKIVVGTDGSRSAEAAVREAARMALEAGATLHLVSAYWEGSESQKRRDRKRLPDRLDVDFAGAGYAEARAALDDGDDFADRLGVEVENHAQRGDPVEALIAVAKDVGADLIVVGNRGVASKLRKVRPAICDRVERDAGCPVHVVDTEKFWKANRSGPSQDSKWT
jgi:nucleotide-binding universal stress UspA family protein